MGQDVFDNNTVSVIMPAYQSGAYIKEAIESVVSQTYGDWELLIYNDGSTDDTGAIAGSYAEMDPRIKVLGGGVNKGIVHARNASIEQACGRYIAFLDSDDAWKPQKLAVQLEFMGINDCPFCYSSYEYMYENSEKSGKKVMPRKKASYVSLLANNYIGMLTVVIDRKKVPGVSFELIHHEDLVLWLRLLKQGVGMMGTGESLAFYRIRRGSLSGNKIRAGKWRWNIFYRVEKLGLVRSAGYFVLYAFNSIRKRPIL
ncbi:MAG: glycosyltransferase [Clostridia bacterium]|nr:glycosyltransferase [Clostridia bacterium]